MFPLNFVIRKPVIIQGMSNSFSQWSASSLFLPLPSFLSINCSMLNQSFQKMVFTKIRFSTVGISSAVHESDKEPTPKLTKDTANSLVVKLTNEERTTLLNTLQQFESEQLKAEFKGKLKGSCQ